MENKAVLNQFKTEVANELGINNYEQIDKGQLTSRQNGYVGGNMTRKMVAFAEQAIAQGQTAAINSAAQTEQIKSITDVKMDNKGNNSNAIDALAEGASTGMQMVIHCFCRSRREARRSGAKSGNDLRDLSLRVRQSL